MQDEMVIGTGLLGDRATQDWGVMRPEHQQGAALCKCASLSDDNHIPGKPVPTTKRKERVVATQKSDPEKIGELCERLFSSGLRPQDIESIILEGVRK